MREGRLLLRTTCPSSPLRHRSASSGTTVWGADSKAFQPACRDRALAPRGDAAPRGRRAPGGDGRDVRSDRTEGRDDAGPESGFGRRWAAGAARALRAGAGRALRPGEYAQARRRLAHDLGHLPARPRARALHPRDRRGPARGRGAGARAADPAVRPAPVLRRVRGRGGGGRRRIGWRRGGRRAPRSPRPARAPTHDRRDRRTAAHGDVLQLFNERRERTRARRLGCSRRSARGSG